jgi:glycosyltransferase involved in cell wall biosynthesis
MISVILPTYNRAAFLPNCVESVLGQTGVELELIVADDGSTDGTEELLRGYRDPRITYHRLPHSNRIGAVRNFAISRSCGEYLAFIDSDDWWMEGKLKRQFQLLEEYPDLGFSLTDVAVVRGGEILKEHTFATQGDVERVSIFSRIVNEGFLVYNSALLLRKSCLELAGHQDEMFTAGCLAFHMRLAYYYKCGLIFEPMVLRRLHEANHSDEWRFHNYDEYLDTYARLYAEGKISRRELHRARGNAYYKLGELFSAERRVGEARKNFYRALRNDLFHVRCYKSLIKSFL